MVKLRVAAFFGICRTSFSKNDLHCMTLFPRDAMSRDKLFIVRALYYVL